MFRACATGLNLLDAQEGSGKQSHTAKPGRPYDDLRKIESERRGRSSHPLECFELLLATRTAAASVQHRPAEMRACTFLLSGLKALQRAQINRIFLKS